MQTDCNRLKFTVQRFQTKSTHLPSLISMVIDLDTTSREARSLAVGAYLSMKRSPSLLMR